MATTEELREKISKTVTFLETFEATIPKMQGVIKSVCEMILKLEQNNLSMLIDVLELLEEKEKPWDFNEVAVHPDYKDFERWRAARFPKE